MNPDFGPILGSIDNAGFALAEFMLPFVSFLLAHPEVGIAIGCLFIGYLLFRLNQRIEAVRGELNILQVAFHFTVGLIIGLLFFWRE